MFTSGVTIFFDQGYFESFFDRHDPFQTWVAVGDPNRFETEWGIRIPSGMTIKGFNETICDEDYVYRGQIWAIGEV